MSLTKDVDEVWNVPMHELVGNKFSRKGGRAIALILCDDPPSTGTNPDLWQNMIHASTEDKLKVFNACTQDLPAMEELRNSFDVVLVMGSKTMIHDNEIWISGLLKFIQEVYNETKIKLVGGCFGHQAIAVALGGKECVARNRIGRFCLTIESIETALRPEPYRLLESHGDEVVKLPPGAERLAKSKTASNEMFMIGDRVLSFQCHPEIHRKAGLEIADRLDGRGIVHTKNSREILSTQPIDKLQFLEDILYPFLDGKLTPKVKL